jgi:transcriptional regulator with PAS, ATPase and Fis domain
MLPVLLLGESGTGKELFARAVHEASARAAGPFVVVDCSGLTETLFESELFGYEKGAFTGANARKPGLVETAKGGTLFLDEMGDVPLSMQVKLLRLIESGTFRRVGAIEPQQADFRLVAATHKPLQQMVADGRFRQDLYYRISAFPIHLPPLRERVADISLLVDSFLQRGSSAKHRVSVEPEAMALMQAHDWPGNIRELRNVLDRARLFADDGIVRSEHLPESLVFGPAIRPQQQSGVAVPVANLATAAARRSDIDDAELRRLAETSNCTRRDLARLAGLSERTLYRRLKALGLA